MKQVLDNEFAYVEDPQASVGTGDSVLSSVHFFLTLPVSILCKSNCVRYLSGMPGQEADLVAVVKDGHEPIFVQGVQHVRLIKDVLNGRGGCGRHPGIRHLLILQKVDDARWEIHPGSVSRRLPRTAGTRCAVNGRVSHRVGVTYRSSGRALSVKSALVKQRLKLVVVYVIHV